MKRLYLAVLGVATAGFASAQSLPSNLNIGDGWKLTDASKLHSDGAEISRNTFDDREWVKATVPGTVLTSLVHEGVYPEPLYAENNRPDRIPESLARKSWWYRTQVAVPRNFKGKYIWLNFEGINYASEVWWNGARIGTTRGAFKRGRFDVTALALPGQRYSLAVLVSPQPHPGIPNEHTIANGMGPNGGITALDGPTFLATIGWDWMPGIRDRNTGIWQKVFLSASGPVRIEDPLVTTDLPLPRKDTADIRIRASLCNVSDLPQTGVIHGSFEGVAFTRTVRIPPHATIPIQFTPADTPVLHLASPKLWWPNGYGDHPLYHLHLRFFGNGKPSDERLVPFGIRKITYAVPDSEDLTISVNGVRVFIRGGNWGMDEAMKRIPRQRLEAQLKMHQMANLNMIRNWVGQSTSEDFYELCDQYGIMLWDEFFQPNPGDGPNPEDLETYISNVRDKIVRFRNHPSIAVWCARNEGYPPKIIDDRLRALMAELEPVRLYQPSSTAGHGVNSGGPYFWREPKEFYKLTEAFKTETGSVSIPTLESIHGMMPEHDWETINDDWAEHDLAKGAQQGDLYPQRLAARYGPISNLADFARKGQLANYEAFRAMYEGRNAQMFHPATGVITWMSNPAQPSFVWQLYHYDLEPNASLYAVMSAGEPIHIQWNESNDQLEVINNQATPLTQATASTVFFDLSGKKLAERNFAVAVEASTEKDLGELARPANTDDQIVLLKAELRDLDGKLLSSNFYWRGSKKDPDSLSGLSSLPTAALDAKLQWYHRDSQTEISVQLSNRGSSIALMAHAQLRFANTGERVLPSYADHNYVTLLPGESQTIVFKVAKDLFTQRSPLVLVDGWNVTVHEIENSVGTVRTNEEANVGHWPVSHLPTQIVPAP